MQIKNQPVTIHGRIGYHEVYRSPCVYFRTLVKSTAAHSTGLDLDVDFEQEKVIFSQDLLDELVTPGSEFRVDLAQHARQGWWYLHPCQLMRHFVMRHNDDDVWRMEWLVIHLALFWPIGHVGQQQAA